MYRVPQLTHFIKKVFTFYSLRFHEFQHSKQKSTVFINRFIPFYSSHHFFLDLQRDSTVIFGQWKLWFQIMFTSYQTWSSLFQAQNIDSMFSITSTVISSSNEDSDFFHNKKYETQKYRKTKIGFFLSTIYWTGLSGVKCYFCQKTTCKKVTEKKWKFAINTSQKYFSMLSCCHTLVTVCHH